MNTTLEQFPTEFLHTEGCFGQNDRAVFRKVLELINVPTEFLHTAGCFGQYYYRAVFQKVKVLELNDVLLREGFSLIRHRRSLYLTLIEVREIIIEIFVRSMPEVFCLFIAAVSKSTSFHLGLTLVSEPTFTNPTGVSQQRKAFVYCPGHFP
jgi:hypothetical protein